jgi:hypothetical protein
VDQAEANYTDLFVPELLVFCISSHLREPNTRQSEVLITSIGCARMYRSLAGAVADVNSSMQPFVFKNLPKLHSNVLLSGPNSPSARKRANRVCTVFPVAPNSPAPNPWPHGHSISPFRSSVRQIPPFQNLRSLRFRTSASSLCPGMAWKFHTKTLTVLCPRHGWLYRVCGTVSQVRRPTLSLVISGILSARSVCYDFLYTWHYLNVV